MEFSWRLVQQVTCRGRVRFDVTPPGSFWGVCGVIEAATVTKLSMI
jgi:hypothetical protein